MNLFDLLQNLRTRLILLSGLIFALVTFMTAAGLFTNAELILTDYRFKTRAKIQPPKVDTGIMTIDWDEDSIKNMGRWPWTWNRHADLVRILGMYDAAQVGFVDDHFSRPGAVTMPDTGRAMLTEKLRQTLAAADAGSLNQVVPRYNEEFADALAEYGRAFLCADFFIPETDRTASGSAEVRLGLDAIAATPEKESAVAAIARFALPPGTATIGTLNATDIKPPIAILGEKIAGLGFNRIVQDPDGVIRHVPATVNYQGKVYLSLSVAMAAQRFGCAPDSILYIPGEHIEFRGATYADGRPVRIPVDDRGFMAINWVGAYFDHFSHFPYRLLGEYIAIQKAKEAIQKVDLQAGGVVPGQLAARDAIAQLHLFTEDDGNTLADRVVYEWAAEYVFNAGAPFEVYLDQLLDGQDENGAGRELWNVVALNNRTAQILAEDSVPDYAALLKELDAPNSPVMRENFENTLHFYRKGMIDAVRPLAFPDPKSISFSGAEQKITLSPMQFKGRNIFVGLTATGLNALNPTPYAERYQMLGMQPNILNTIVNGEFIHEQPYWSQYLYAFFYALLAVALSLRLNTAWQTASTGVFLSAHVAAAWLLFAKKGLVIPVLAPSVTILAGYTVTVLYRYLEALRERRKVRGLFSAMVSPDILKIMEDRPDRIGIAGEKKDASMFSSDVSGFTTISEGVTAQELANILNIYLTPMSNLIMKYGGYVDKYEGDAIKAEFGVPLPDEDHAWKGACSALEQQEELTAIARMLLVKYGVKITARMGVNTGIVSAGNMGSDKKMQYTVMGEQVTLAEELEPVNKLFESWIAIGPDTEKRSRHMLETRLLGVVKMGPSHHPTPVTEPLGWKRDAYLKFWEGKPVPPLLIEAWKKIMPEKIMGYVYYYSRKQLPDSAMKSEVVGLFTRLAPVAMDQIRTADILAHLEFRDQMATLEDFSKQFTAAGASTPTYDAMRREIEALEKKVADATAPWEKTVWEWKLTIRRQADLADRVEGKVGMAERDEFLKQIDTLEKKAECYWKRVSFPGPDDEVGTNLAEHLKALFVNMDPAFVNQDRGALQKRIDELKKQISDEMNKFLASLQTPEKAKLYHEFMADHCCVSEKKLQLREIYDRARAKYLARDWDGADAALKEALALEPTDGPSIMLGKHIAKLRKNPPPDGWEGHLEEE